MCVLYKINIFWLCWLSWYLYLFMFLDISWWIMFLFHLISGILQNVCQSHVTSRLRTSLFLCMATLTQWSTLSIAVWHYFSAALKISFGHKKALSNIFLFLHTLSHLWYPISLEWLVHSSENKITQMCPWALMRDFFFRNRDQPNLGGGRIPARLR